MSYRPPVYGVPYFFYIVRILSDDHRCYLILYDVLSDDERVAEAEALAYAVDPGIRLNLYKQRLALRTYGYGIAHHLARRLQKDRLNCCDFHIYNISDLYKFDGIEQEQQDESDDPAQRGDRGDIFQIILGLYIEHLAAHPHAGVIYMPEQE